MTQCDDVTRAIGRVVLFIGQYCHDWQPAQFVQAAQFARAHGVDSIAPKRYDGTIVWGNITTERAQVLRAGCGYLPFLYSYGPRFGQQQIRDECAALARIGQQNAGIMTVDMEAEWNGHPQSAALFNQLMRPVPGILLVSTWADPDEQGWDAVVPALAPCVNAWGPQQYSTWLASRSYELARLGESCVQPQLDLTDEFGANDQLAITRSAKAHGATTIWLWEYQAAVRNPHLVDQLVAIMKG